MYESVQTSPFEPVFYQDENGSLQEDIYYVALESESKGSEETSSQS